MRKWFAVMLACLLLFAGAAFASAEEGDADISEDEIEMTDGTQEETAAPVVQYAEVSVKKGTLNLRKTASSKGKVIAKLPNHTIIQVLEKDEKWTRVCYGTKTGYVSSEYISLIEKLPYDALEKDDRNNQVLELKKRLQKLKYLASKDVNNRFDDTMEKAVRKFQLLNGFEVSGVATPELQAFIYWGKPMADKSGYSGTATDKESGLTASIFCWDSDGMLYEEDQAVRIKINFATQVQGGQPPYTITVTKTLSEGGSAGSGDVVTSPFTHIWKQDSTAVYLWVVATDADGNSVAARARFKYTLPARYQPDVIDPDAID